MDMNKKINDRFEVNIDLVYNGNRYSVEVIDHEKEDVCILDFTFASKSNALDAAYGYIHGVVTGKASTKDPLIMAERISYLETELAHSGFHDGWIIRGLKKELEKLKILNPNHFKR